MMPGRLVREESGMTMALALMVMVLVGVMGAGLLVFVRNDLQSVLESNQGQIAFNLADAGAQTAKSHLFVSDADFRSYDGTTNLSANPPNPESPWSCGAWDATNKVCTAAGKQMTNLDGDPDLDATVWIQYLKPATTSAHLNDPRYAPELVPDPTAPSPNYPPGKDYFKVISSGKEGGARRTVEAIFNTHSLGVPKAYYTPGNITLSGGAGSITNISLFAGGNVDGKGGQAVVGEDYAYGNWCKSPFNTAARATTGAGIGALGNVTNPVAGRDFDATSSPAFVGSVSGAPSSCGPASGRPQITFPFSAGLPDIEALRAAAQTQENGLGGDNYYELTTDESIVKAGAGVTKPVWPANAVSSTVVFVKFDDIGDKLTWNVGSHCSDVPVRGTLVVENGIFTTSPNATPLRGSIVIKSAPSPTDVYTDEGNTCMQSYAVATGDIQIKGNVDAATQERGNSPGSYGMRLWSWRECYSPTCS
jgi:hypothetical protein